TGAADPGAPAPEGHHREVQCLSWTSASAESHRLLWLEYLDRTSVLVRGDLSDSWLQTNDQTHVGTRVQTCSPGRSALCAAKNRTSEASRADGFRTPTSDAGWVCEICAYHSPPL